MKMETFYNNLNLDELATELVVFTPRVLVATFIMLVFWVAYRLIRTPLRLALSRTGLHNKLIDLLVHSVFRYSMVAFGLVMSLSQLGVDVGAAVAGLGVAGIAVGLAAQDTLANTIAGFTVFWDKPFVVGDYITVAGQYGRVTDITLRSTRIRTPQNSYVVIPNKRIIDEVLDNGRRGRRLRVIECRPADASMDSGGRSAAAGLLCGYGKCETGARCCRYPNPIPPPAAVLGRHRTARGGKAQRTETRETGGLICKACEVVHLW
ncbi:MAG: mechanosensitive ion channel family protein [Acidobacteriota bacterium]